jgi:hypothetical protein
VDLQQLNSEVSAGFMRCYCKIINMYMTKDAEIDENVCYKISFSSVVFGGWHRRVERYLFI